MITEIQSIKEWMALFRVADGSNANFRARFGFATRNRGRVVFSLGGR